MSTIAVYRRVSTADQDTRAQELAVNNWLAARFPGVTPKVFEDVGFSGKRDDRPQFKALCAAVAAGEVQVVVVFALDRLSRKATTALQLLIDWINRGVEFFAVNQPILQLGKDNPFRLTFCSLMAEVAEIERETIVARVKSGIKAAQARGIHCGRPSRIAPEIKDKVTKLRHQGKTFAEIAAACGISAGAAYHLGKTDVKERSAGRKSKVG